MATFQAQTRGRNSRKRSFHETESIENDRNHETQSPAYHIYENPRKRQKLSPIQSVLKNAPKFNHKTSTFSPYHSSSSGNITDSNKKPISIFYQISDYTPQQIHNILKYTKFGENRPILLFADNDIDNFWIRSNRHHGPCRRSCIYDGNNNTTLIGKYDHYGHKFKDFMSVGIITKYLHSKQALDGEDMTEFKAGIDAGFEIIHALIEKNKMNTIIIPSKFPLSKRNKNEIFHRLDDGLHGKHKHLWYIQQKINELERKYAKNYTFVDCPVLFDHKSSMRAEKLMAEMNERKEIKQILS